MNFRGEAKPYQDLLRSMATEEMGHVEQITNTINMLLEGASEPSDEPDGLPLSVALDSPNIHHFLVAGQSARPVDAAGNPWSASYVYDSGNLVLNMIYNLMLESTGRLQKCRLYQMSNDKAFRSTVSYLIVRDLVHEKVFAKALEALGVDWGKAMPIPRFDTSKMPEVRDLERKNLHNQMWTFANKGETSLLDTIFRGDSPFDDGGTLEVIEGFPEGHDIPILPDAPQEFASGLDSDLIRLTRELQTISKKNIGNGVAYPDNNRGSRSTTYMDDAATPASTTISTTTYSTNEAEGNAFSDLGDIDWEDVIKKEARGIDDSDLGEVKEVDGDYVITKKGIVSKDKFYLPKNLAVKFDGHKLWFKVNEDEMDDYRRD
jgi:Mn-containing catalase